MKIKIVVLLLSLGCHGMLNSQNFEQARSYVAFKAIDPIIIDGKASEVSWENTPFSEDFIDIEGEIVPKYRTNVKMVYDEDFLYFYAKMEEPHVWATLKQRDTVIFYNNDFEIFIDPDGDTHNYYEFEINALNTVWDLFIVKPYREPAPIVDSWEILGLKSAVHIEGTLNDPSDKDKFWSVEVAIPWKVLTEANTHSNIPKNEFWRINFSRVNWEHQIEAGSYSRKKNDKGTYLPEYNWVWSPQGVINMHEPERWGYVYFSDKMVGEEQHVDIPEDEEIRWLLYELYREQKTRFKVDNSWATRIDTLRKAPILIGNQVIKPQMDSHKSGWNIWVKSPFTGKTFLIKEDGEFTEQKN